MLIEVKVPAFPESVTDGVVAAWHRQVGDRVARDEALVDIETDKVLFEVPSPVDGVIAEIREAEGATVVAGATLACLQEQPAGAAPPPHEPAEGVRSSDLLGSAVPGDRTRPRTAPAAGPAVRRQMAEAGLGPGDVEGSGPGGRILGEDVQRAAGRGEEPAARPEAAPAPEPAPRAGPPAGPPAPSTDDGQERPAPATPAATPPFDRPQRREPMSRLRARIAERLLEAQQNAAILTTFNEVNMQPVLGLRARYRDAFEARHGTRLGIMSFFVRAVTEALRRHPVINASIEDETIVYHGFYDIGIAVASPRGLVVPVLRDTDRMSMADIERAIASHAERAASGALTLEEITGGTFTISNGGVFGSLLSTPILNPPQSAILGMHRIEQRPVVEEESIVARPMMYLALSYDHRLIDGREAVLFLVTVRDLLEDPARLLLEV